MTQPTVLERWQDLVDVLAEVLGVSACAIVAVDEGSTTVLAASGDGPFSAGARWTDRQFPPESMLRDGREIVVTDAQPGPDQAETVEPSLAMRACLALPAHRPDGRLFGMLCALHREPHTFSTVHQRLAAQLRDTIESHLAREDGRVAPPESDRLLLRLLENVADGYFLHDEQGRILKVNRRACESLGYQEDELLALDVDRFVDGFTRETLLELWAAAMPGQQVTVPRYAHRRKDGTTFPVEVRLTCYAPHDDKLFLAVVRDVSDQVHIENALLISMERFRLLVEYAGEDFFLHDDKGRILDVNYHACVSTGYSRDELLRMHVRDLALGLDQHEKEDLWNATLPGHSATLFSHHRRKDGSSFPVEVRLACQSIDGQKLFLALVRDISERVEAEQAIRDLNAELEQRVAERTEELRRSEARWQFALEGVGYGVWDWHVQKAWVFYSRQWKVMLGLADDGIGHTIDEWTSRIHPEDAARVATLMEQIFRGELSSLATEHRMRRQDGQWRWILTRSQVVERSEAGQPVRMIGTSTDITERKEAEQAILTLNERFELAVKAGRIGIWEVDFATGRFSWNEQMLEFYGLTAEEFDGTGGQWLTLVHPDDLTQVVSDWDTAIGTTGIFESEFRIVLAEGQVRHLRALAQVSRNADGTPRRVVGTSWDVTSAWRDEEALRAAKDEAEAAERAKGEFLAVVSHELRTPMNSILGMVRLALQTDLTAKQRGYLDKVNYSAKALVGIINDVLDFSKIEAGKMEIEAAEFTVDSLLESVANVTAMNAEEKGLELVFDVAADVPGTIVGDSLRLGQVLINLVNNAVKFTEHGEVVVRVERGAPPGSEATLLDVSVRDTGIGIEPTQQDRLFHAFSQADVGVSRQYGGTGLGLAICRRLVEMMGGTIWAESEPGHGSVFRFTVRIDIPARRDAGPPPVLAGQRLLIVEDIDCTRAVLSDMARRFGMTVQTAHSGLAAIAAMTQASERGTAFDLVLMDWQMPDMNGIEAVRLIESDIVLQQTPTVLMTMAFAREDTLRQALGSSGVLIKPVTPTALFAVLTSALGVTPVITSVKKGPDVARLRGRRVLVVDDSAMNRDVIRELLQQVGVIVDLARDGVEALARLTHSPYDVVLMDVEMAKMDGLSAVRELRTNPRLQGLPVLALTGHVDAASRQAISEAGMNDHIAKPVDADELYAQLLRWVAPSPPLAALAGKRVLVVDDNALNREVVLALLEAVGMHVTSAQNGLEALEHLETETYDIVLMDIQMPQMSGLDATRIIRKQPHTANIPIIALTAQAQESDRDESLTAGMNAHLVKPIDEALLYDTLVKCLSVPTPAVTPPPQPSDDTELDIAWPAQLPGIDLNLGVSRLAGSRQRLMKFLRGFLREFSSAPAQVDGFLRDRDYAALGFTAHSVKSVAAYIGAEPLAEAARLLEEALERGGTGAIDRHAGAFRRHLDIVLSGVHHLFNPAVGVPSAGNGRKRDRGTR